MCALCSWVARICSAGNTSGWVMVHDRRRWSVRELFPAVIQWLTPAECLLSRETHNDRGFLCADCQRTLPRNEHACRRCATPMSHSKLQIPGAPRRSRCPACHMRPTTCERILAPFSCKVRFGSSFIFGSSRITPALRIDGPPLCDHHCSSGTATAYAAEPE